MVKAEDLESLKNIVSEYYEIRNFKAKCIDGTELECSTLDELLQFENISTRRIESVSIRVDDSNGNYIGYVELENSQIIFSPTCSFSLSDTEDAHVVSTSKKLEELVKDLKQWYSGIRKLHISIWLLLLSVTTVSVLVWYGVLFENGNTYLLLPDSNTDDISILASLYLSLPLIVTTVVGLFYLDKFWVWLFPKAFFGLGRQKIEWSRRTLIRNWGIGIVGTSLIGLVISILFSSFNV